MMRLPRTRQLVAFIGLCGLTLDMGLAAAQVPHLVRYQGHVVDSQQVPLEGEHTLKFKLYPSETGGVPAWQETHSAITLSQGNFSVLLGSVQSLEGVDWNQSYWLSIQVDAEPELTPRQQITSVPLAIRAQTAEIVKTSGLTDDANTLVPSGAVILWTQATCPAGYTRLSELDGRFLVGDATYQAAAGGSNTHSHGPGTYKGPRHAHVVPASQQVWGGDAPSQGKLAVSTADHQSAYNANTLDGGDSAIAGQSEVVDSRPLFAKVLLCKKD